MAAEEPRVVGVSPSWTPGQQLDHIWRSVAPLTQVLRLPEPLLRLFFGRANRPSRPYAEVVARYQTRLAGGGRASGRYLPAATATATAKAQKQATAAALRKAVRQLTQRAGTYSEPELDACVLPHPLLGKLTLREMLCFTLYHVEHHHKQVAPDLA